MSVFYIINFSSNYEHEAFFNLSECKRNTNNNKIKKVNAVNNFFIFKDLHVDKMFDPYIFEYFFFGTLIV